MVILDLLASNPDVAIAIGGAIAGWLGVMKKNDGLAKLKDKALARLRQEVLKLLDEHASPTKARASLEWAADSLLSELDIKRSKSVDAIVEVLVEQALKEYTERFGTLMLRMRIDELFGAVSKLPDAFTAPAKPLGLDEPLLSGMQVEIVK